MLSTREINNCAGYGVSLRHDCSPSWVLVNLSRVAGCSAAPPVAREAAIILATCHLVNCRPQNDIRHFDSLQTAMRQAILVGKLGGIEEVP